MLTTAINHFAKTNSFFGTYKYLSGMHIVVNTVELHSAALMQHQHRAFVYKLLHQTILQQTQHTWTIVVTSDNAASFSQLPNTTLHVVKPLKNSVLLWHYWLNYQLPAIAQKQQAQLLLSLFGVAKVPANCPQILLLADAFTQQKTVQPWFYQRFFSPEKLQKATQLITATNYLKERVGSEKKINTHKISVVHGAVGTHFQHISNWEAKQLVKNTHTDGKEYFLCCGALVDDAANMLALKAFSIFKKWQKSNMKLVLYGLETLPTASLTEKLATYKYREDVVVLPNLPEQTLAQLTAAAYACLLPNETLDCFAFSLLQAMQCGTPVISTNNNNHVELGGDAVLYAANGDVTAFANHLQQVYKNENLRADLCQKVLERAQQFTWKNSLQQLANVLAKTVTAI